MYATVDAEKIFDYPDKESHSKWRSVSPAVHTREVSVKEDKFVSNKCRFGQICDLVGIAADDLLNDQLINDYIYIYEYCDCE